MEKLTNQQKKNILIRILEIIVAISDKEYQRRVWIRGEGPEVDDFGEAVCGYSSLTGSIFKNYKEYGISDIQFPVIKKFHDAFQKFWDDNDWPEEFIDTPEWTEITEMAKDVLQVFDCTKEKIVLAIQESRRQYIHRKKMLEDLLSSISHISEKKTQKKTRIYVNQLDNFSKSVSHYFKNIELILKEYRDFIISTEIINILKRFHEKFEKFWKSKDSSQLFTATPEWNEIVDLAKDVLKAFKYNREEEAIG